MHSLMSDAGGADAGVCDLLPGVLVVDDDATLRAVLARALRKRGFAVWAAAGGEEALRLYAQNAEQIDVVLMDVSMPGVSGPEAHAAIRAEHPHVRCVFMTADLRPGLRETLLASGALEVLSKPFSSLAELCDSLRHFTTPSLTAPAAVEEAR